jgi:Glyoxalase-like domain
MSGTPSASPRALHEGQPRGRRAAGQPVLRLPDSKIVKNRVHLDMRPTDRTREQETERVIALGATKLADHRRPDGSGWITLADPEGNEFCILSKDPARSGATT